MKTLKSKLMLATALFALAGVQMAQAESRKDKVQRDTRAGAAGGAVVASFMSGPQFALAGGITGGTVVGTCSRVAHSGEVTRAKKDLKRHKENAKAFAKST